MAVSAWLRLQLESGVASKKKGLTKVSARQRSMLPARRVLHAQLPATRVKQVEDKRPHYIQSCDPQPIRTQLPANQIRLQPSRTALHFPVYYYSFVHPY